MKEKTNIKCGDCGQPLKSYDVRHSVEDCVGWRNKDNKTHLERLKVNIMKEENARDAKLDMLFELIIRAILKDKPNNLSTKVHNGERIAYCQGYNDAVEEWEEQIKKEIK